MNRHAQAPARPNCRYAQYLPSLKIVAKDFVRLHLWENSILWNVFDSCYGPLQIRLPCPRSSRTGAKTCLVLAASGPVGLLLWPTFGYTLSRVACRFQAPNFHGVHRFALRYAIILHRPGATVVTENVLPESRSVANSSTVGNAGAAPSNVVDDPPRTPAPVHSSLTKANDLVLLVTGGGKRHLLRLQPGRQFHSHLGKIKHDDLIESPYGTTVYSQLGHALLLLEPSLDDAMTRIKRNTQIIYPKDAAIIVQRLNLRAGSTVIEAGTGSGGLAIALAWAIAPSGRVYSYEIREEHLEVARGNLRKMGLLAYVDLHHASILEGFRQKNVDALVLDVRTPWLFLEQAHASLRPGGFFCALVPTTNQVSELLRGLEEAGFADINVEEILVRKYKPVPDRLRPDDTMVGHTGFLTSARPIVDAAEPGRWLSDERKRYEARKKMAELIAEEEKRDARREKGERHRPRLP